MQMIWKRVVRYRVWLIAILVIVAAAKAMLVYHTGSAQQAPLGPTVLVGRSNVVSTVSATGTIEPITMVDISSKISGLVEQVKVNENDRVKAGQVLLVLDDTHLQAQVAQARARLSDAAANFERNRRLQAAGAVSEQQLESASMDYNVAQATYDDAVSQLDETVIRTPIDGQVIGKPITAGQAVAPGISSPMVLLTVADLSQMQIQTQVDESDVGKMQVGQKVTFTVDAYPGKTFTGVVSNISQKANVVSNVVYYSVLVNVEAGDELLKPTMTARVSINVGESKNALVVPLAAVKANNAGQYAVVVKNGKAQNIPVTTGIIGDDKIEITSGLSEGDQVMTSVPKQSQPTTGGRGGMIPGLGR